MKKLEDVLLKLKFDVNSDDFTYGQQESIKFCIRKHEEGWTLDDFYKELYNALSMNVCSEYVQGIISGFKYNIKIMEETKNEQSYASTN